jgi:hypothetical protein
MRVTGQNMARKTEMVMEKGQIERSISTFRYSTSHSLPGPDMRTQIKNQGDIVCSLFEYI